MPCIQISCNLSFNLLKDARSEKGLASRKSLNDLQTLKQSIMKLKRIFSAALIFTLMFSFSDIFAQRSHHRYQQHRPGSIRHRPLPCVRPVPPIHRIVPAPRQIVRHHRAVHRAFRRGVACGQRQAYHRAPRRGHRMMRP